MEMLFEVCDENSKRYYKDKSGMYLDVCEWECVVCDADKRVIQIEICELSGSIQLSYLPPNATWVDISTGQLEGSIDVTKLPPKMCIFSLEKNLLSGTADLSQLPQSMEKFHIHSNQFSGSVDLAHLPDRLMHFSIKNNQLTGSFIATSLPRNLVGFFAGGNNFEAVAVVDSKTDARIDLRESGVKSAVDESGRPKVQGVEL